MKFQNLNAKSPRRKDAKKRGIFFFPIASLRLCVFALIPICHAAEPVQATYQNANSLTFQNTNTMASNLVAGANVTLSYGSNGVATIAASGGGGGGSSLATNSDQFAAVTSLTVKDKALLTNTVIFNPQLLLSNINGTASTSRTNGATLSSNVSVYTFSSGFGNNMTLSLPTNSNFYDGQTWQIMLGTEGTNVLNLTPTNFSAATADKIYRSTNIVMVPGTALTIQKQGTNFNIIGGLPGEGLQTIVAFHRNFGGTTNYGSFFAPCLGQVLVDAGSPFNGMTMPDANTRFLRGGDTSGPTGGSDNANHTHDVELGLNGVINVQAGSDGNVPVDGIITSTSTAIDNRPAFLQIVWIMRVK